MYFRNLKKCANEVNISDPIDTDKDGNTLTLIDVIADDENIVENIDLKIKMEKLYQFINEMSDERERLIIKLRYGIGYDKYLTQREVAQQLGISRSYVSRIEKKALAYLKRKFDQDGKAKPVNLRATSINALSDS